jgi:hypothetical protein
MNKDRTLIACQKCGREYESKQLKIIPTGELYCMSCFKKPAILCTLCAAGNTTTYVESYEELTKHFITHDIHQLAYAYSDLLEIIEWRKKVDDT